MNMRLRNAYVHSEVTLQLLPPPHTQVVALLIACMNLSNLARTKHIISLKLISDNTTDNSVKDCYSSEVNNNLTIFAIIFKHNICENR